MMRAVFRLLLTVTSTQIIFNALLNTPAWGRKQWSIIDSNLIACCGVAFTASIPVLSLNFEDCFLIQQLNKLPHNIHLLSKVILWPCFQANQHSFHVMPILLLLLSHFNFSRYDHHQKQQSEPWFLTMAAEELLLSQRCTDERTSTEYIIIRALYYSY